MRNVRALSSYKNRHNQQVKHQDNTEHKYFMPCYVCSEDLQQKSLNYGHEFLLHNISPPINVKFLRASQIARV